MLNEHASHTNKTHRELEPESANGFTPPVAISKTADTLSQKETANKNVVEFGSAENDIAANVAADVYECNRINGAEDFFGSVESRIRERLKPTYKVFRRATFDKAYCDELAKQLNKERGGNYAPSSKKPACLAAFLALNPATEAHSKQTYDAAYFLLHAAVADVSPDGFASWIEGRSLKASIAFMRSRKKKRETKAKPYPNIAKAKKLKSHPASARILKEAWDMAEDDLKKLFESEPVDTTPAV